MQSDAALYMEEGQGGHKAAIGVLLLIAITAAPSQLLLLLLPACVTSTLTVSANLSVTVMMRVLSANSRLAAVLNVSSTAFMAMPAAHTQHHHDQHTTSIANSTTLMTMTAAHTMPHHTDRAHHIGHCTGVILSTAPSQYQQNQPAQALLLASFMPQATSQMFVATDNTPPSRQIKAPPPPRLRNTRHTHLGSSFPAQRTWLPLQRPCRVHRLVRCRVTAGV
jgi:hypothetical protein